MDRHGFDMSFVAPGRHDEIARRIGILQTYLQNPSRKAAIEGARQIGIGLVAFYNLAKAWRNAPRPENVAGSGRPRVRRSTMSAAQITIVDEAIGVAFHQSPERIVDLAFTLAAAAGIELPARNIVRRRVDRTKPASIPSGTVADGADFVLDECVVDIAVSHQGRTVRPLCSVLFDVRTKSPIGMHLSTGLPGADVAAATILDALRVGVGFRHGHDHIAVLDLHVGEEDEWAMLMDALDAQGVGLAPRPLRARGSGQVMIGVLGTTPGINFMPRHLLDEDRTFRPRDWVAVTTVEDATAMLRGRFEVDAGRASVPLYADGSREELAASLSALAAG